MCRLCLVLCTAVLLVGLVVPCAAQERPMLLTSDASVRLLEEGRSHLLHVRVAKAETAFRELARRPDGAAAASYYLAYASFLKALITDEQVYFDEFFERSDGLESVLDDQPPSTWNTYLRAEAHLQRAVAWAKTEHYMRAALAGRSAYLHFKKAIEADGDFYEPYKGMGLFHVMIGAMPSTQRKLLRIMGYGGSVQEGLRELHIAAERSVLNAEEATLYLALTDILLNNSEDGGPEALKGLYRQYPQSPLFAYLYGYALLVNRDAKQAEGLLRAAVEAGTRAEYFYLDYAAFYLAQGLFRQNRFEEAEQYYRHYLKRHRGPALKALAYLELGETLDMQGRWAEAVPFYEQVTGERTYDSDRSAHRAAQKHLEGPMTDLERTILLGANAYDAGQYAAAETLLGKALNQSGTATSEHTEAAYRLGRVYQARGRLADALAMHRYVIALSPDDPQARWEPWSQFYVGEIYAAMGEDRQAMQAMERALAYEPTYDYHQSLEQQARIALGRIREGTAVE